MDTGWTKEHLRKLFAAVKANVAEHDRMKAYCRVVRRLDWKKVAFPPFSPKDCQEKWTIESQKIRKYRTLAELVDEAADKLSQSTIKEPYLEKHHREREQCKKRIVQLGKKSVTQKGNTPGGQQGVQKEEPNSTDAPKEKRGCSLDGSTGFNLPAKPPVNSYNLFCKEQLPFMDGVPKREYTRIWVKRWHELSDNDKLNVRARHIKLKNDYAVKLNDYLSTLDTDEQQRVLDENGIKRPKVVKEKRGCSLDGSTKFNLPAKPPVNSYILFCKEQLPFMDGVPKREYTRIWVKQWHELSDNDKLNYRERHIKLKNDYAVKLNDYLSTLDTDEQQRVLDEVGIKRPKAVKQMFNLNMDLSDNDTEEPDLHTPSDSEDEEMEGSSSDEDETYLDDDMEDDDVGDTTFDMF